MESAIIAYAGNKLTIFPPSVANSEHWYDFDVALESPGMIARLNVPDLGPSNIVSFYSDVEAQTSGWNGERCWQSIEGNLRLAATIDRTGHIACKVSLRKEFGRGDWSASCLIMIDSGAQLSRFVAELKELFSR